MFIKCYSKENKKYYVLTHVIQKPDKKVEYLSEFIPEDLANLFAEYGVKIKTKESK